MWASGIPTRTSYSESMYVSKYQSRVKKKNVVNYFVSLKLDFNKKRYF